MAVDFFVPVGQFSRFLTTVLHCKSVPVHQSALNLGAGLYEEQARDPYGEVLRCRRRVVVSQWGGLRGGS